MNIRLNHPLMAAIPTAECCSPPHALVGLLMLSGEYLLPYLPYGLETESGSYLYELYSPRYLPSLS